MPKYLMHSAELLKERKSFASATGKSACPAFQYLETPSRVLKVWLISKLNMEVTPYSLDASHNAFQQHPVIH